MKRNRRKSDFSNEKRVDLRVYVAGKYSDNNVMSVLHNIRRGIEASYRVFKLGLSPFCPWLDYQYVLLDDSYSLKLADFYAYSISWLKVSDAMVVLPGYERSTGTMKEIVFAKKHKIPIFYNFADLIEWKRSMQWKTKKK